MVYLADIFGALRHLTLSLQGPNCTATDFILKRGTFAWKLDLWMKNVENKCYVMLELMLFRASPLVIFLNQNRIDALLPLTWHSSGTVALKELIVIHADETSKNVGTRNAPL